MYVYRGMMILDQEVPGGEKGCEDLVGGQGMAAIKWWGHMMEVPMKFNSNGASMLEG